MQLAQPLAASAQQRWVPPPEPSRKPEISSRRDEDKNGDKIEDELIKNLKAKRAAKTAAKVAGDAAKIQQELAQKKDVRLVFSAQVTQKQIDDFVALGGEITYIFKHTSFGWNGLLPEDKIDQVPALMGGSFVAITESKRTQGHLDRATSMARARPIWANGFAGSVNGFDGDPNITIGIIDSGVDATHTDLAGRNEYWHDWVGSFGTGSDPNGHGSHVAGIALGTGNAGGLRTGGGNLNFTLSEKFTTSDTVGNFRPAPFNLAAVNTTVTLTATWTGGGSRTVYLASRARGANTSWGVVQNGTGSSPLTFSHTFTPTAGQIYSPALLYDGVLTDHAVTVTATNQPASADNFNIFRGMAPACQWAGFRALNNDGGGNGTDLTEAIDDLVGQRVAHRIRVANMSIGTTHTTTNPDALDTGLRDQVNTAVLNGILMSVSAGNDGSNTTTTWRNIGDPARARLALTVAASNDENRLTEYTSLGATTAVATNEDQKPDLMAPGGSFRFPAMMSLDSNTNDGRPTTEGGTPTIAEQRTNDYKAISGTSMAAPVVTGAAALIVDALTQQAGFTWDTGSSDHPRFVKMLLCATASESNAFREDNATGTRDAARDPYLGRAAAGPDGFPVGKDRFEGYGMLNPDAAIDSIRTVHTLAGGTASATLGDAGAVANTTAARVWGRGVSLLPGKQITVSMTPPAGGDFDLYLYSAEASVNGTPILLASSTNAGNGTTESFTYTVPTTAPLYVPASTTINAFLMVKRAGGNGSFNLTSSVAAVEIAVENPAGTSIASGSTYAYGNVTPGTSSTRTFTIRNTGASGLQLTGSPAVSISGDAAFTVTAQPASLVAGSGSTTFNVRYAPTVSGSNTATLSIANDDTDENPFTIALTGTGNYPPVLTQPSSPVLADSTSAAGANVTFSVSATDTEDGSLTPSVTPASGSLFPIGDTTVNVSATDSHGSTTTGSFIVRVRDTIPPTVVVTPTGTGTDVSPVIFTLTFSENVTGLTAAEVTTTGGTKGALSGSGSVYTIPVTSTVAGAKTCMVTAGAAQDAAGNSNTVSNTASVIYDATNPTMTISAASVAGTKSGPVSYTVTYADANFVASTLSSSNITLIGTAAAANSGAIKTVTGSGSTRTVTLSGLVGDGLLGISIPAGTGTDIAGNPAPAAATTTANDFIVDNTAPIINANTAALAASAASVTISGPGGAGAFSLVEADNIVAFNNGAAGTVTGTASATLLTVTFSSKPQFSGPLIATVADIYGNVSAPVQIRTVNPAVTLSTANIETTAPITISGFGFGDDPGKISVQLSGAVSAGPLTPISVTPNLITLDPVGTMLPGNLSAVVTYSDLTTGTQTSGAAVQVATVVAPNGSKGRFLGFLDYNGAINSGISGLVDLTIGANGKLGTSNVKVGAETGAIAANSGTIASDGAGGMIFDVGFSLPVNATVNPRKVARATMSLHVDAPAGGPLTGYVTDSRLYHITPEAAADTTGVSDIQGIVCAGDGSFYLADSARHVIWKVPAGGAPAVFAGSLDNPGLTNATGTAAQFNTPIAITVDTTGNLYVSDNGNNAVRKITTAGVVTTAHATVDQPRGIAWVATAYGANKLFIVEGGLNRIMRSAGTGTPVLCAGSTTGLSGQTADNVNGSSARFSNPTGLAAEVSGDVYVADTDNHVIRRITAASSAPVVSVYAGAYSSPEGRDGLPTVARFSGPRAVAVDVTGTGVVWVLDDTGLRSIDTSGQVATRTDEYGSTYGGTCLSACVAAGVNLNKVFLGYADSLQVLTPSTLTVQSVIEGLAPVLISPTAPVVQRVNTVLDGSSQIYANGGTGYGQAVSSSAAVTGGYNTNWTFTSRVVDGSLLTCVYPAVSGGTTDAPDNGLGAAPVFDVATEVKGWQQSVRGWVAPWGLYGSTATQSDLQTMYVTLRWERTPEPVTTAAIQNEFASGLFDATMEGWGTEFKLAGSGGVPGMMSWDPGAWSIGTTLGEMNQAITCNTSVAANPFAVTAPNPQAVTAGIGYTYTTGIFAGTFKMGPTNNLTANYYGIVSPQYWVWGFRIVTDPDLGIRYASGVGVVPFP